MKYLITLTAFLLASTALAAPNADHADFVNTWHGTGADHQANNEPKDRANDRHNFDQATAGKSGKNPAN